MRLCLSGIHLLHTVVRRYTSVARLRDVKIHGCCRCSGGPMSSRSDACRISGHCFLLNGTPSMLVLATEILMRSRISLWVFLQASASSSILRVSTETCLALSHGAELVFDLRRQQLYNVLRNAYLTGDNELLASTDQSCLTCMCKQQAHISCR